MKRLSTRWWVVIGLVAITITTSIRIFSILAEPALLPTTFGVTFSQKQAEGLGLNWQEAYTALLDDLGVKHVRLIAYWDAIEPALGRYAFTNLDYQMDQAAAHDVKVLLVVGRKVPRWPECHLPMWAGKLSPAEQQQAALEMLETVVQRYANHPALDKWQLDNEPLLDFGECPPIDTAAWLTQAQASIRSLSTRPILVTDSGELNWWWNVSQYGDEVGTTMYRTVFSSRTQKQFSYDYLFPAWLYRAKAAVILLLRDKFVLIAELQGEPWAARPYIEISPAERQAIFPPERLPQLARFAERTHLTPVYWWGAEYWYWEKEVNNNPAYWEEAQRIF